MQSVFDTYQPIAEHGPTPDDHVLVLFGATGDLARRKLLPGLFRLEHAGLMPERYRIVGTSRAPLDSDEPGVAADSQTETFVALRVAIDNSRWAGVPFYLRTGKRMAETRRLLTITFREPPRRMFGSANGFGPTELVFDLADRGGISASFQAKVPGPDMRLGAARFRFDYDDSFAAVGGLEAYERLIHDALVGDHTLFTRADGIERLWEVSAPVLEAPPPVRTYAPGSWGPPATDELIAPGSWHLPDEPLPVRPGRS
jgi:glucose-6-phosphate 1-dehydrogenase